MLQLKPLTPQENQAIEELKRKSLHLLTPRMVQDETLFYRFLKDQDFNMKQAEVKLIKHISDYKIYDVENLLKSYTPPEYMVRFYPCSYLGFDKEGSPIHYCSYKNVDPKGLLSLFNAEQLIKYQIYLIEKDIDRLTLQSKKLEKSLTQISWILDMDNLNLFQATNKKGIDFLLKLYKVIPDNYPERIKALYIINTSRYFNLAASFIKTVLTSTFLEKIHIYGKDGWRENMLEIMDADELPAFLGGNKTDPDGNPLCKSFVVHSEKIPEDLYMKKFKNTLRHQKGVKKLTIGRSSSCQMTFEIDEPNTEIEWEFETKSRDISFALYYKDDSIADSQLEELIPKERMDTHLSTETGLYKCDKIGLYIMEFCNSYSWLYSKELYYRIQIIKKN